MMQITCNAGTLRALPLFSLLTDSEREAVQPSAQIRTFAARTAILRSGDVADGLYVILAGRVGVLLEDHHGHRIIVDHLQENETFGELALFQSSTSLLTFECQRACEILYIPRKPLLDALHQNCAAAVFMANTLAQRLQNAYRKLGSIALEDVYARVMDIMLVRGHEQDGAWFVDVGAEAMSAMVGASREMVSRVMKDLVQRGLVRRVKRKLVVDDRDALHAWATERRNTTHERKSATATARRASSSQMSANPA